MFHQRNQVFLTLFVRFSAHKLITTHVNKENTLHFFWLNSNCNLISVELHSSASLFLTKQQMCHAFPKYFRFYLINWNSMWNSLTLAISSYSCFSFFFFSYEENFLKYFSDENKECIFNLKTICSLRMNEGKSVNKSLWRISLLTLQFTKSCILTQFLYCCK